MKKVLIVDDEHLIADSVALILSHAGYQSRSSYSADEALVIARDFAPDILLTDVVMPGSNGFELALQIRELFPECRIFVFSGQSVTADLLQIYNDRGMDFQILAKPIHPQTLIEKLNAVVEPAA
jgi:DNA-binding response OmpR family regulator